MPKNHQQRYRGLVLGFENTPQTRVLVFVTPKEQNGGTSLVEDVFNQPGPCRRDYETLQVDTHRAHGVQDGDDRHAHVAKDGKPHVGDAERREHQDQQLNAQRKDDVLPKQSSWSCAPADRAGNVGRLVVHEHDVGSLNCGVGTHGAHGNANVCTGEHGRIVDAVAYKGELALARFCCKQRLDTLDLITR